MAELYDILDANRVSGHLSAFAVPDTYTGTTPDVTITFPQAPVGKYIISFNWDCDFGGARDKALGYTFRHSGFSTDPDDVEYADDASRATSALEKNRAYGFEIDVTVVADLVWGLQFRDVSGGNGFVIDHCDVAITHIANL